MPRIADKLNLAYVHARPTTVNAHGIFYVGKGRLYRARTLNRPNVWHKNIVSKYGKDNILIGLFECSTEAIAFDLEKGLIKCLRRMGVKLVNATNGGDGPAGRRWSEEWRAAHSAKMKGRTSPAKGKVMSEEQKAKIRDSMLTSPLCVGRQHTAETKAKCGNASRNLLWITDGFSNRRVEPTDQIPTGWVKGMAPKKGQR